MSEKRDRLMGEAAELMDMRDILIKRLKNAERKKKLEIALRLKKDLERLNEQKRQIDRHISWQSKKMRR